MVVAPLSHSFGFDGTLTTPSGGKLPEDSYARFVETRPDATTDEIRERWERDGYLYVKGLLNPENVRALRTKFFEGESACVAVGSADASQRRHTWVFLSRVQIPRMRSSPNRQTRWRL